jgi:hypothetical protein
MKKQMDSGACRDGAAVSWWKYGAGDPVQKKLGTLRVCCYKTKPSIKKSRQWPHGRLLPSKDRHNADL